MSEREGTDGSQDRLEQNRKLKSALEHNRKLAEHPALVDAAIADRVRRFREELGLSQSQLSLRFAINGLPWWKSSTVGITEAGRRKTHIYEVAAIAKVFELSVEEFLSPDPAHDNEETVAALQLLSDRLWPKPDGEVFVDLDDDERPLEDYQVEGMLADLRERRMREALEHTLEVKLGMTLQSIDELALLLWDHGAAIEMQSRLAAPVGDATPQARGHITRQLIKELKAFDTSLSNEGGA